MFVNKHICPVCGGRTIPLWCKIFSGRMLSCECSSCGSKIRLSPKQNGCLGVVFYLTFPVWIYVAIESSSWVPIISAFIFIAVIQVAFIRLEEKK